MHTVFRIGDIKQLDRHNPFYQVDLQLTSDDDPQLRTLTERIREETTGCNGWGRLGQLLLKIGQFNKAEELYNALLEQTSDQSEKAFYYIQLGCSKYDQGKYDKAILYYQKALEIYHRNPSTNLSELATTYGNLGGVYYNMREYSKALSFYDKDLEIRQKTLPPNHPSLATSYNNIGEVYRKMGEYSKALSFYEKALEIYQKTLPPNHPLLATSYNNIGWVYRNMKQYSKAFSYFERALDIWQRSLPPNHPHIQGVRKSIETVKKKL